MRLKSIISFCVKRADDFFLSKHIQPLLFKFCYHYYPKDIYNINLDLANPNQKRILICYVSPFGIDIQGSLHAAYFHLNQMVLVLSRLGWCIDICFLGDKAALKRFQKRKYDVLLGQGLLYLQLANNMSFEKKILFCSENNPDVVAQKYAERLLYFKQRHPNVRTDAAVRRDEYFSQEHLALSDELILINSEYNSMSFRIFFKRLYTINVNAISNGNFRISDLNKKEIGKIKKHFVLFGCNGLIHKGLDILCDVFRLLPDCQLHVFGLTWSEKTLFDKLRPVNVIDCGFINVSSPCFIKDVIMEHVFCILPSCSEGMASGVATCMIHGLIPIITKEAGFDPNTCIIELTDYKVETIEQKIVELTSLQDDVLVDMQKKTYLYAIKMFSINNFTKQFNEIMQRIL